MRIYFDGNSWSGHKNVAEDKSYPHLLCKSLGVEYDNFSFNGGSNQRMARNMLIEKDITKYDLAILDFSDPQRLEFIKEGKWDKVTSAHVSYVKDFWTQWYKHVYTDEYGLTLMKMWRKAIEQHCILHQVPLVGTTYLKNPPMEFDFYLQEYNYDGHPNEDGHQRCAIDLEAYLVDRFGSLLCQQNKQ